MLRSLKGIDLILFSESWRKWKMESLARAVLKGYQRLLGHCEDQKGLILVPFNRSSLLDLASKSFESTRAINVSFSRWAECIFTLNFLSTTFTFIFLQIIYFAVIISFSIYFFLLFSRTWIFMLVQNFLSLMPLAICPYIFVDFPI